jgi:hypothetical protein
MLFVQGDLLCFFLAGNGIKDRQDGDYERNEYPVVLANFHLLTPR